MALLMGELFVVWCCWVDLSLLDINQVLMEMEVRRPQSFYYKQLSVLVVLFCFGVCFWVGFRNVRGDIGRKND